MTEIPSGFLDILTEKKALAHLATLQPDGSPQVTPVWFDFTHGVVRVNTAKGRVKARNLSEGSNVALSIVDPDNDYRYIQIRGTVTKETTDGADAHIDSLAKKYLDKDAYPFRGENETRVIYEITRPLLKQWDDGRRCLLPGGGGQRSAPSGPGYSRFHAD